MVNEGSLYLLATIGFFATGHWIAALVCLSCVVLIAVVNK